MELFMSIIQWISIILFGANSIDNLIIWIEESEPANFNAAMGWLCALLWVIISML
jgi:hypothetical protein